MTSLVPAADDLVAEVTALAMACLSGDADHEDAARLDELLRNNDEACRIYVRVVFDSSTLRRWGVAEQSSSEATSDPKQLLALVEADLNNAACDEDGLPHQTGRPPFPGLLSSDLHGSVGHCSFASWPVAYLIATVVFGVGLTIAALVHVSQPSSLVLPSPVDGRGAGGEGGSNPLSSSAVARITGMVDCVWEGTGFRVQGSGEQNLPSPSGRGAGGEGGVRHLQSLIPNPHSLVSIGDRLALRSGLLELTYETGAKVILQGPVTYEVESPTGGYLSVGKLTAKLEKKVGSGQWSVASKSEIPSPQSLAPSPSSNPQSLIPNPLFAVRTPTALVTDLGTEFGVEVDQHGYTTSHVYRGLVRLQPTSAGGKTQGESRVLSANQTARVERNTKSGNASAVFVSDPSVPTGGFVREISKRTIKKFDLVDVVAGGDGFSGRRNRGIDPTNGRIVEALRGGSDPAARFTLPSDGQYHRAEEIPFVDGVFIPDGGKDKVQVDSAGHVFDLFRGTTSATWQYVWAGGAMPAGQKCPTTVGDVDYASPGHGLLFLHASNAITFDLEAIRRANSGFKLLRFRAAAANREPGEHGGLADIWVLVDGQSRFRRQVNNYSGVSAIMVPIGEKDRFLTLAATDGRNGIAQDWIIFGDPRLELLPVVTNEQKDTEGH